MTTNLLRWAQNRYLASGPKLGTGLENEVEFGASDAALVYIYIVPVLA
jgi:hypothetical protein